MKIEIRQLLKREHFSLCVAIPPPPRWDGSEGSFAIWIMNLSKTLLWKPLNFLLFKCSASQEYLASGHSNFPLIFYQQWIWSRTFCLFFVFSRVFFQGTPKYLFWWIHVNTSFNQTFFSCLRQVSFLGKAVINQI